MTASALVGQILSSRYRIVKLLGEGGMGAVYEAQHVHLDKRVVVKTLHDDLACDPMAGKRFRREAWATARIEHPNIVRVTDVDVHEERLAYFVMEYLPGEDLAQTLVREGPLPWPRVRKIGLQICSGLVATHAQKVIHRDLKPSNCFRVGTTEDDEQVKILDFGIAKILDPMPSTGGSETVVSSGVWQRLTQGGVVFGTFAYMSPEHVRGDEVDFRTDVYGVGVILYQLLTNRLPIPFDAVNNLLHFAQILVSTVPPPPSATVAGIPEEFDRLVARALAKRKEDRFASMQELMEALRDIAAPAERGGVTTTEPRPAVPLPSIEEQAPTRVHTRTASREAVRSASVWRRCSLAGLSGTVGLFCASGWLSQTAEATPLALASALDGPFQSPLPSVTPGSIPTVAIDAPVEVPRDHTRPVRVKRTPRRAELAKPEPAKPAAGEPESCNLDPYDRLQLVQLYRKQVARQCKQALLAEATIPVRMRIVRGKVEFSAKDDQPAQQRAAAECIAQQLEGRIKAPSGFAGCATAWGTIMF
jgi:serine/threonine protein kinase